VVGDRERIKSKAKSLQVAVILVAQELHSDFQIVPISAVALPAADLP
jgi:hypothetical protein